MLNDLNTAEADADAAAVVSIPLFDSGSIGSQASQVTSPAFAPLTIPDSPEGLASGLGLLLDISVELSVELGRNRMTIAEVLGLRANSVVGLEKLAGEPVDVLVNGSRIARGEVVIVDEKFGVRILEVEPRAQRLATMG